MPCLEASPVTDASAPNSPTREPNIKGWPGLSDLMKYYPPDAERQGIEGMVDIQVTLDAQSHVTDTLIREEHPANMGFDAAASALAHVMEFDNPTGQAAQLAFKVKFALDKAAIASGVRQRRALAPRGAKGLGNYERPAQDYGTGCKRAPATIELLVERKITAPGQRRCTSPKGESR